MRGLVPQVGYSRFVFGGQISEGGEDDARG
jgi:hypothetical protein